MTMRAKILGGFVLISAIGLILGAIGLISARMLTDMSSELYALQNSDKGVSTVLNAHYIWRQGLTESVLDGSEFTGSLDPQTCALGKWKGSEEAQNITDPEITALLNRIDEPHSFIHNEAKILMEMLSSGDSGEAKRELLEVILPRTQEVITILTGMEERYAALTEEKSANIVELGNRITVITVALVIFSAIACVLLAWRITAGIMKPLQKITLAAERIAVGDLDVSVSYKVNDQIGRLARSFQNLADNTKEQVSAAEALADGDLTVEIMPRSEKDVMNFALGKMISNLNNMFEEIQGSALQVSAGSKQIASGAQSLAQGSTEQASAVEELSASVNEIAHKTKQNANIAKEAAELSSVIRENAEKGNSQMEYMMQAVKEINEASRQIEKVIKVIDDIAFQTNILALNAAVEAARAGSAGKGFAVVAEEVRNLAAKSAEAAKDTGGLIENSVAKANLGLTIATETSASLKEIVEGINRSAGIVTQIALLSDEQAGAIIQVNTGIDQVAQVVQQNSATAQESAAASEEMNGQSDTLGQLISQFKLKNAVGQRTLASGAAASLRLAELAQGAVCALPESDTEYGQY